MQVTKITRKVIVVIIAEQANKNGNPEGFKCVKTEANEQFSIHEELLSKQKSQFCQVTLLKP